MAFPVTMAYCRTCDGKGTVTHWDEGWVINRCPECEGRERRVYDMRGGRDRMRGVLLDLGFKPDGMVKVKGAERMYEKFRSQRDVAMGWTSRIYVLGPAGAVFYGTEAQVKYRSLSVTRVIEDLYWRVFRERWVERRD